MLDKCIRMITGQDAYNQKRLKPVAEALHKCRRCLVVTGAGISVAGGVPDFRSAEGLYDQIKEEYRYNCPHITKGADMFNARIYKDPESRKLFYTFIGRLKSQVDRASHTTTHELLKILLDRGQLLRCYTQNIDDMEGRVNIPMPQPGYVESDKLVQLHGSLAHLKCTSCHFRPEFTEELREKYFVQGLAPACWECEEMAKVREAVCRRQIKKGELRPNIIMYDESNPTEGEIIADCIAQDLRRGKPDLVLVMGTSLRVDGIRTLLKDVARAVHEKWGKNQNDCTGRGGKSGGGSSNSWRGKVIYVNKTLMLRKEWDGIIDMQVNGNAEDFSRLLTLELARMDKEQNRRKRKRVNDVTKTQTVQKLISDTLQKTKRRSSTASIGEARKLRKLATSTEPRESYDGSRAVRLGSPVIGPAAKPTNSRSSDDQAPSPLRPLPERERWGDLEKDLVTRKALPRLEKVDNEQKEQREPRQQQNTGDKNAHSIELKAVSKDSSIPLVRPTSLSLSLRPFNLLPATSDDKPPLARGGRNPILSEATASGRSR